MWSEITSWLPAEEIGHVWLCGNKRVNRSLGEGGAVKEWKHESPQPEAQAWPGLVQSFVCMTHFTLSAGIETAKTGRLAKVVLKYLPTTLQSIDLTHPQAESAWIEPSLIPTFPEAKGWKEHFCNLKSLRLDGLTAWNNTAMCSILPDTLESLSLIGNTDITKLDTLPRSLTYLKMPRYLKAPFTEEDAKSLPRSLTRFKTSTIFTKASLAHLPPQLRKLDCNMHSMGGTQFSDIQALPSSLTSLILKPPPLILNRFSLQCISRNLTCLNMFVPRGSLIESFEFLPETLKKLKFRGPDDTVKDECLVALPPQLEELYLETALIALESLEKLPPSLKRIEFPRASFESALFALLPRQLRVLTVRKIIEHRQSSEPHFEQLPRTLEALTVTTLIELPFRQLRPLSFPPALTVLQFGSRELPEAFVAELPPSLTHLVFSLHSNSDDGISSLHLSSLPSSLKSLALCAESYISLSFGAYPPQLKELKVLGPMFDFDEKTASSFPRSLTTLVVSDTKLNSNVIPLLPRSLAIVDFGNPDQDHKYWEWRRKERLRFRI
jgi:hypothetical protein